MKKSTILILISISLFSFHTIHKGFRHPIRIRHIYRALYSCDKNDPSFISYKYVVGLTPGHTFEQHSAVDMTPYLVEILPFLVNLVNGRFWYSMKEINGELLERIRSDIGVDMVECANAGILEDWRFLKFWRRQEEN